MNVVWRGRSTTTDLSRAPGCRLDNMTAHGKVCPTTGEMVYIGYNLIDVDGDGVTNVTVGVVDAEGRRSHRATIPVLRPSM